MPIEPRIQKYRLRSSDVPGSETILASSEYHFMEGFGRGWVFNELLQKICLRMSQYFTKESLSIAPDSGLSVHVDFRITESFEYYEVSMYIKEFPNRKESMYKGMTRISRDAINTFYHDTQMIQHVESTMQEMWRRFDSYLKNYGLVYLFNQANMRKTPSEVMPEKFIQSKNTSSNDIAGEPKRPEGDANAPTGYSGFELPYDEFVKYSSTEP